MRRRALSGWVFDRHADDGAVFGPRAVVVLDVLEAQELFQDEPAKRRALANAAVGNHVLIAGDAFAAVELAQLVGSLERAVLVGCLVPRDVRGAWYVAGALGSLGHTWRGDDLAVELGWRAHVDQCRARWPIQDVAQEGAQREVRLLGCVGRTCGRRRVRRVRSAFGLPLLASAVHQRAVLMAVDLAHPVREGREPVVGVAVEDDARVVADARFAQQLLPVFLRWN